VLKTSLKYEHLFLPEESDTISNFLKLDTLSKTIYARMFFRKRFWYTNPSQLKSYAESEADLEKALKTLYKSKLLKSDEDSVYETDYEKIHELFECMQMQNVKVVEDELRKVVKGNFEPTMPKLYHNISNNPFWQLKQTCEQLKVPSC
jgi:hypothetical protein